MIAEGLDPENPADRLKNDEAVNEEFRRYVSDALFAEYPGTARVLQLRPHPQAWGRSASRPIPIWNWRACRPAAGATTISRPAPAMSRRSASISLARPASSTPHGASSAASSIREALIYEIGQMVALGAKCLVGDQLHPNGAINHDTYRSIAPGL